MTEEKAFVAPALTDEQTREQVRGEIRDRGWWVSIPVTTLPVDWLYEGEHRLDGRYYADRAFAARRIVEGSELKTRQLGDAVEDVFLLGRFKRIYARDPEAGWPYLTATEALDFRPTSDRWIASEHAPRDAERHFAREGWILLTCSGTVGRLVIASKRLEEFFLTHDLIRIVPSAHVPTGYLYAFLSSWIGQALLARSEYGAAVKHLEPHHVAAIRVPFLPKHDQEIIHHAIMQAHSLRDEANALLDAAEESLYRELVLSPFDPNDATYIAPPSRRESNAPARPPLRAFATPASELDQRLDASYHMPVAHAAIQQLRNGKYPLVSLDELVANIYIPPWLKRIYVEETHGVPFIQGSHLPQMKPRDLQYLSKTMTNRLERWIIHRNWVLITCSGTIGRISVTPNRWDGWAATQHILRLIPDQEKGHPGYLATFLTTPYGQHQLTAKIYGGVVDELTEEDTAQIRIPNAPLEIQAAIGEKVVTAYNKKAQANLVEDAAVKQLENSLKAHNRHGGDLDE